MRSKRLGIGVAALCGLALGAALWTGSLAQARTAATITVGAAANGTTVRLRAADTLVVRLAGNPTTGYRWSVKRAPAPLHLVGSTYKPSPPGRLGQGGTYVFRFRAKSGSGKLELVYRRPWEKRKPPLRTFSLTVRVR